MKKTLYSIMALTISLLTVSCNDFLEETPKGQQMANGEFTENTLNLGLGVLRYKVSRSAFGTTQFEQAYMGDDLATHPKSNKAAMREWDNMEVSSGNERLLWHWQDKWEVIKAANFIISGAGNSTLSESTVAKGIATAKFWRAWAYFDLVRVYGALPLVTDLLVDYSAGLTSVQGIYDVIVEDLKYAEDNLPNTNTDGLIEGISVNQDPNKGAAQAMLCCVYLNMAGWPLEKGNEYYKLAADQAKKVIDGGYGYELYSDYKDIHSHKENNKNKEAIISIYFSDKAGDGDSSLMCRGGIMDLPDCSNAWCDTRGELKFWYEFPDGYRKDIVYPKTVVRRNGIYNFWEDAVPVDNRFPYFGEKAWRNEADKNNGNIEYDFTDLEAYEQYGVSGWDTQAHMVIRLSEVYCWYAEALARSGGDLSTAAKYLNDVRNRADNAKTGRYSAGMGAEALAEAAYNEHRWEIGGWWAGAIESCFNDMARLKRAEAHYNYRKNPTAINCGGVMLTEPYGPEGTWADYKMFVDYPSQEKLRNPNLDVELSQKTTAPFINGTEIITK